MKLLKSSLLTIKNRGDRVAKPNAKEIKEKKEIAKTMMNFYGLNYNEWLHNKHQEFIDENLMSFMQAQNSAATLSDSERNDAHTDRSQGFENTNE